MTAALEGLVVSSTPRPQFTTGKGLVPILEEAGWLSLPVWRCANFVPTGIRSRTFQACVAQSLYRLCYCGPHQSLIFPFNSRIKPCAHSATSCRQHLSTNCLLRTAKTNWNSSEPIAQLKAKHDIHTCAVICQYVQWSETNVFERHKTCGTHGNMSGRRGVMQKSFLDIWGYLSSADKD
jgi:hypothetical protein